MGSKANYPKKQKIGETFENNIDWEKTKNDRTVVGWQEPYNQLYIE